MSFNKLLVANRGEIASRVMRSAHQMGIRCVAVYTQADADAPFVKQADEAMLLPGGYLDGKGILEAARISGAQAIHPGYGFLSENAAFAEDVFSAGLTWVGPSPQTIQQMGDKIAAKAAAQEAKVPTLPGSEDPSQADNIGYPILVKASAGGGGKGMRIVENASDLDEAIVAAKREAANSFGDDRIFLERFVTRSRHIEIQILGDQHGNLVHLGERECSIQRRHQKIIEESPSPRVSSELRQKMGEAALRLAQSLNYQSAGTVEFLLDDKSGEFFFLEVNTRLQVEHPVTEAVTGLDLVREQLRLAQGEELGYCQDDITWNGSAIEVRLYAEDPSNGFLPATGTLHAFQPANLPGIRWDSGVTEGSVVGTDFDPMLAKVIAHAKTRGEAANKLALELEGSHIGGTITNLDFLSATLRSDAFLAGDTTTDFIERVDIEPSAIKDEASILRTAQAVALWVQANNHSQAGVLANIPSGWRNARMPAQKLKMLCGEQQYEIQYQRLRDDRFRFNSGEHAEVYHWSPDEIDIAIDNRRQQLCIKQVEDNIFSLSSLGNHHFRLLPRFELPGSEDSDAGFTARMPGKVIELRVQAGDAVRAGDTLLVLEAMKMEHPMTATEDGVVQEVRVTLNEQVESGAVLLVVEAAEPGA